MKTIVDINTGKVLFATYAAVELLANEIEVNSLLVEKFVNPYWNFTSESFYEKATIEEVNNTLIPQALDIDLYYTGLISDLLRKHIEKLSIDGIPIPQDVIDERDRLRAECNQKILDLGVINFSYRQSNLKL